MNKANAGHQNASTYHPAGGVFKKRMQDIKTHPRHHKQSCQIKQWYLPEELPCLSKPEPQEPDINFASFHGANIRKESCA
ncbi:MAG: hypothetical protein LBS04_07615 [Tannerellaceae bacterium]|nr:hypothetical protein [Tannerellaceae bacterium]